LPTLGRMLKHEKPEPTTSTEESDSDLYVPEHPLRVPDPDPDLREGESLLTFLAPPRPPSRDE
jgi:hypothetical protein